MTDSLDPWLREGIAAAQAGQVDRARACLLRAVEADERSVQAWYWLSRVAASPQEREICLENVLALDPSHTAVQAELAELRRLRAEAEASLLSREAISAAVPRTAEEELIAEAAVEPLRCPYCDAVTQPGDRGCPACGGALFVRRPKSKDHSIYSLGLVAAWLGLANCVWLGLFLYSLLVGLFSTLDASAGAQRTLEALGRLLGTKNPGVSQPAPARAGPDTLLPVLLVGSAVLVLSLFVAWGLYRRWRFFYWLTIAVTLLYPLGVVYWLSQVDALPWLGLVLNVILFLALISFAFTAYDEFTWVERRLDAALDQDVNSPSSLYARGRGYAGLGMWAKAAAHWSKAVALSPGHPEYRLALATAYVNLGRPERALEHVHKAQEIEPHNPQVRELLESLPAKMRYPL